MKKLVWMFSVLMIAGMLNACSSAERNTASAKDEGYRPSRGDMRR